MTHTVREVKQVLPKIVLEEHIATPHGRECSHLLCVLAVQCPLNKSNHSATGTLYPYRGATFFLYQSVNQSISAFNSG